MNRELRRKLQINGVTYYLAVNQYGPGAPTVETPGKPAVLYMDTDTGDLYKCTAADVKAGAYTWEPVLGELAQELEDLKKTGYVRTVNGIAPDENGNVEIKVPEPGGNADQSGLTAAQITALDNMFKVCAFIKDDVSAEYNAFQTAFGIGGSGGDAHTHSYTSSITTAATCTTAGVKTYTCSCGHSYTESIPATGHNYVDGVCTVCGAADPTYTPGVTLTSISAVYNGGEVPIGTAVTDLTGIVVTAHYSNGTSATVVGYTLSGTIAEGNNTITVTYEGQTATFVVVGANVLTSISATYSGGSVTVGTAVSDLTGIVVTAHYSDGTSEPVTAYTMTGMIGEGSNTITVNYGGKTTTFTVVGVATDVSNETKWTDGVEYTYEPVVASYIDNPGGEILSYDTWSRTPHLYCAGASKLRIQIAIDNNTIGIAGNEKYNAFYDANKNFIQNFDFNTLDGSTVGAYTDIDIPANAVYFIVSHKNNIMGVNPNYGRPCIAIIPYL